jgi:hypothetical protein
MFGSKLLEGPAHCSPGGGYNRPLPGHFLPEGQPDLCSLRLCSHPEARRSGEIALFLIACARYDESYPEMALVGESLDGEFARSGPCHTGEATTSDKWEGSKRMSGMFVS